MSHKTAATKFSCCYINYILHRSIEMVVIVGYAECVQREREREREKEEDDEDRKAET